ncbi:MAG: histidinol-phosphate transaminase [Thermacetogeniaceae bacterium]
MAVNPFVPDIADLSHEQLKKRLGVSRIIKLSMNENPLGPSHKAIAAMEKALRNLNHYSDCEGNELREKICAKLGVDRDQVILTNGADEMIFLAANAFIEPGDEVVIPFPTFGSYFWASALAGARIVQVPLRDFCIDTTALLSALSDKTRLIFLCNPNNPTGTIIRRHELEYFLDHVNKRIVVVLDEAYVDYVVSEDYVSGVELLEKYPNLLVIRTFSKIHSLAAARVGYGVGCADTISVLNRCRLPFNVNYVGQMGAAASIDDIEHLERSKRLNNDGKRYLEQQLQRLGCFTVPSETNFLLVDTGVDARVLAERLLQKGIVVRPGDGYKLPTFMRVSIGLPEDCCFFVEVLEEALSSLR